MSLHYAWKRMKDFLNTSQKNTGSATRYSFDLNPKDRIITHVTCCPPSALQTSSEPIVLNLRGMWDTGSVQCGICQSIATKMKLPIIGYTNPSIYGQKQERAPIYQIILSLTEEISFFDIPVVGLPDQKDFDFLIGLDIIRHGRLCVDYSIPKPNITFEILRV